MYTYWGQQELRRSSHIAFRQHRKLPNYLQKLRYKWHRTVLIQCQVYGQVVDRVVGIATRYGLDGPGIEYRCGSRFSATVQTGPGPHPAYCTMGTGSFQGVNSGRCVTLTPHPLLVPWSRKSRAMVKCSVLQFFLCHSSKLPNTSLQCDQCMITICSFSFFTQSLYFHYLPNYQQLSLTK